MINWDTGCIIPIPALDMFMVITQRDYATNTMRAAYFKPWSEADKWSHDESLKQMPKWHKENCQLWGCGETKESK